MEKNKVNRVNRVIMGMFKTFARERGMYLLGTFNKMTEEEAENVLASIEESGFFEEKKYETDQPVIVVSTGKNINVFQEINYFIKEGYNLFCIDKNFYDGCENKTLIEKGAIPIEYKESGV